MTIKLCTACNSRYVTDNNSGDFVHQCNSGIESLDNEDVLVIGTWEDYTGSETIQPAHITVAGQGNDLWGTRAALEGAETEPKTSRGNKKSIYRTRRRENYITK